MVAAVGSVPATAVEVEQESVREVLELHIWDSDDYRTGGTGEPIAQEIITIDSADRDALFNGMRELAASAAERYAARLRSGATPETEDGSESDEPQATEKTAADAGDGDWRSTVREGTWLDHELLHLIPPKKEITRSLRVKLRTALTELVAIVDNVSEAESSFGGSDHPDLHEFPESLCFSEAKRRAETLNDLLFEIDDDVDCFDRAFQFSRLQELGGTDWKRVCELVSKCEPGSQKAHTVLRAAIGLLARAKDPAAVIAEFEAERIAEIRAQYQDTLSKVKKNGNGNGHAESAGT